MHHWFPLNGCSLLTRGAHHGIYDHNRFAARFAGTRVRDHRIAAIGPAWYRTWFIPVAPQQP
ncbi:MAG: hypothetical protein R3F17_00450 [Planctomycetota bacterium]